MIPEESTMALSELVPAVADQIVDVCLGCHEPFLRTKQSLHVYDDLTDAQVVRAHVAAQVRCNECLADECPELFPMPTHCPGTRRYSRAQQMGNVKARTR